MNQARLTERVLARVAQEAERDPQGWLPAVGWIADGGGPHGLALELIGEAPTDAQLRVLARVLYRLANDGVLEVATFRDPPAGAKRLGQRSDLSGQEPHHLVYGGSKPLTTARPYAFGVRLTPP